MLNAPNISPDIVSFKLFGTALHIRWYGFFYVLSFILGYILYRYNLRRKDIKLKREDYETLVFYVMMGVILGGRIGYVLFYNFIYFIQDPLSIFAVWQGGMSFHGGALGVIIAGLIFCNRKKYNFYTLADPAMPLVAIGLGLGRLGNFINQELFGIPTSLPWGMVFKTAPDQVPRHPTQLYEMLIEGVALGLLSQYIFRKSKRTGMTFWFFIGFYGFMRYFIEFVRVPDELVFYEKYHWLIGYMTIGQVLSLIMVIAAIFGLASLLRRNISALPGARDE